MAALTTAQRQALHARIMRHTNLGDCALTKIQLRNAIDAADAYADSIRTAYNSALPAAAQSGLTAAQKALILTEVVRERFDLGA